ncbi:MAG: DUF3482 domain-containing protein [Steroidobacteraceae bacterium]|nr:DUF3482 domain-containing protein [Nevskiaceae bacterium]MCP5339389.1 DUF3482 domain-containing protein [Nevskiaceae bacterium]MCP5466571.1 DUF3482 domain-containing protein [Nevskiaceae bacterium]MCP5471331.1 DUF3482 domain-containing protein [Nevskiaceae bacterium]
MNVELALVSHTNAGKTTLARTLLGRDVGDVRDAAHVTDLAERYELLRLDDGTALWLWDTPGFGDSARLLQRLRLAANPLGWLLREAWDRWRDRPFWCSQQAVRAARESADVVLYLVNAAEDPRDAGYLAAEIQVLRWVGRPVIVLLNQVGPPREAAAEQQDLAHWRRHLDALGGVAEVLALDAFARCWVHETVLLEAIARVLPPDKAAAFAGLAQAWVARSTARFEASMALLAGQLAAAALDREPVPAPAATDGAGGTLRRLLDSVTAPRTAVDPAREAAMNALATRLDAGIVASTDRLIVLHGLDGSATRTVLERLGANFAAAEHFAEGRAALWGSVVTGALTGLKADLASGGLTLGGGLLLGGLLGGLAGAGVARGLNRLSGADEPRIWWSDEALEGLARSAVLRYLAVAHFGRGRGRWTPGEAPASWQDEVAAVLHGEAAALQACWQRARELAAATTAAGSGAEPAGNAAQSEAVGGLERQLQAVLGRATAAVLARLYPDSVPPGLGLG